MRKKREKARVFGKNELTEGRRAEYNIVMGIHVISI
jgi:hypothetical protein